MLYNGLMARFSTLLCLVALCAPASAGDLGESARFEGVRETGFNDGNFTTPPSLAPAQDYDTVIFHGLSSEEMLQVEVSFEQPGGGWSTWRPTFLRQYENGRFWGRANLETLSRTRGCFGLAADQQRRCYDAQGEYITEGPVQRGLSTP